MIFRRQESFRYTFNNPVECLFKIIRIDDVPTSSEFGQGEIIDISPSGLKMTTPLNLSPTLKKIEVEIHFDIDDWTYQIPGVIQWQKKELLTNGYSYGIKLDSTDEIAANIIDGLKQHAENMLKLKKFK